MDFPKGFEEKYEQILGEEAADFFATFDEEPISSFRSNPLKEGQQNFSDAIPQTDWGFYGKAVSYTHLTLPTTPYV